MGKTYQDYEEMGQVSMRDIKSKEEYDYLQFASQRVFQSTDTCNSFWMEVIEFGINPIRSEEVGSSLYSVYFHFLYSLSNEAGYLSNRW